MNLGALKEAGPPSRSDLDNGTVLLTVPVASAHSVSIGVWVRRGTQDEPVGLGGLAHFLEHIVFKGSVNRSGYELARLFDDLGASVDAFTSKDHVAFMLRVLPDYLQPALDAVADMVLRPALDPDMIALEQNVVCEEIQEARDTPEDLLNDAFVARLYRDHPRSRPILGSPDTVRSFTADILRREHGSLFRGENLVVSAAGMIPDDLQAWLREIFGRAPAPDTTAPLPEIADAPFTAASEVIATAHVEDHRLEISSPIQQCYFELGNRTVSYLHPDRVPLAILANLLGGGMSSRIFQAVREREGLAYSIYTYLDMGRDIGMMSCAGSCSPGKMERLEDVVRREYRRLLTAGLDEVELESNRAQIKSQLVFGLEGSVNQMGRAAKDEIFYGEPQRVDKLVDEVDSVTREDVMRCAATYGNPDDWIVAIHGPAR